MVHPDLQRVLDEIDAAEADATKLVRGLADPQANWRPKGGAGWSVAQCLDHLAKTNTAYMQYFQPIADQARQTQPGECQGLRPTWFGRTFIRILEPPVRQRAKAPSVLMPPTFQPVADALAAYTTSLTLCRTLVETSTGIDVNRVVAPNPWIKTVRMRLATALLVPRAHDRRHLWQARQVLAQPDFPAS